MQLILNIKNESIAKKILWLLEHFRKDGLEIKLDDGNKKEMAFSDEYISENWHEFAYKASGEPEQDDDNILRENYGKYLSEKHSI